ncbi:MAG: Fe-S-containing hydro-lyase [Spirochaetes bacterium]|jgi:fumarate hydratase subunit beta|nr:Fe-S-containing hydro-lyase [Spirochaetota bacterium]MBP8991247.1 Fe-S-containing hydro-lyase [Spirochaetota bacterium]NLJ05014.1 Fe-S-containing hydro-lyase [Exilispira sp.]HOV45867.1 Fe-S-containing hydro-lyase [Exilispira sp.]
MKNISTPLSKNVIEDLKAGEEILLSGYLYTARDVAHSRLCKLIKDGKPLPFDIKDQVFYFVGPTPPRPGYVIGSAGPTTSYRMDEYSPILIEHGLSGMIGKGNRSSEVIDAMIKYKAVYFAAIGGAGALIARCIKEATIVCYEDLGPEAIRKILVVDMPLIVAIDCYGNNLYKGR